MMLKCLQRKLFNLEDLELYETLIMLKPGETFTMDEMKKVVKRICQSEGIVLKANDQKILIAADKAWITLDFNQALWVLEESNAIASAFGLLSEGCSARYEMNAEDADMRLYNAYLLRSEALDATGKCVIFDQFFGKLFGAE